MDEADMITSTLRRPQTRRCAEGEPHQAHIAYRGVMAYRCPGMAEPARRLWPEQLQWMTSREVAAMLDVSLAKVNAMAREGRIPYSLYCNSRRFRRDQIEAAAGKLRRG
jgi:excisionase family DNA binding protein